MSNLDIYSALRAVPKEAQKVIQAGRLKGMTDINPMWRIKALTDQFGPAGIGWRYEIVRQWTEAGSEGAVAVFCNINLYYKYNGEWSEAIPGTGGSMLIAKERNGLYTSDECYKMALTDAISVSAKALGVGADVYWQGDRTKYNATSNAENTKQPASATNDTALREMYAAALAKGYEPTAVVGHMRKKYNVAPAGLTLQQIKDLTDGYNSLEQKSA